MSLPVSSAQRRRGLAAGLPDFPWDTLAVARATAEAHPGGIVDLSIGTPIDSTPELAREALSRAADSPGYPLTSGTRALRAERSAVVPFLPGPLPARPRGPLDVDDLVRFVERPARAFLRQRLDISVADYSDEVADALSVELGGLEEWGVGNRIVEGLLAGAAMDDCVRAEIARGASPEPQSAAHGSRPPYARG